MEGKPQGYVSANRDEAGPHQSEAENGVWRGVQGRWRRVYGSFPEKGVSIEWHDFFLDRPLDRSPSIHRESLEICLNFRGIGSFEAGRRAQKFEKSQALVYATGKDPLPASLSTETRHQFLTFEFSRRFLAGQLESVMDGLKPSVLQWMSGRSKDSVFLDRVALASHFLLFREHILRPPVSETAANLWIEGKIMELLSSLVFRPGSSAELFCQKHHRQNREFTEHILYLLSRDMENPPSLEMLGKELGRSPYYLSRIFSETTGQTIPATLRQIRMERAAGLLRDTGKSVTEIAFEVGYSSIGAFNKAFRDQFGTPPSDYRKK